MKATDMKHELESYGIDTKTMFDKRDFEKALIDARRDYEQTIKDCLGSTHAYKEKKQQQRKTVNYDRANPDHFREQERMWNEPHVEHGFRPGPSPDQVGVHPPPPPPREPFVDPFAAAYGAPSGGGPRRRRGGIEEDPLFAHEARYTYGGARPRSGPGPYPGPGGPGPHHQNHRRDPRANGAGGGPSSGPAGGRSRVPHPHYKDPAVEMKYHEALKNAHQMKVEDLQKELNDRGISTKFCFVFGDFCIEYAKAIAENKAKKSDIEDLFNDDEYDPSYRDVVMERYDPTSFI
jgi:hypothetical protein